MTFWSRHPLVTGNVAGLCNPSKIQMYIYPEVRYNNITIELWKPRRSQTIMFSENTRGLIYTLAISRPSSWYIWAAFSQQTTIWHQLVTFLQLAKILCNKKKCKFSLPLINHQFDFYSANMNMNWWSNPFFFFTEFRIFLSYIKIFYSDPFSNYKPLR